MDKNLADFSRPYDFCPPSLAVLYLDIFTFLCALAAIQRTRSADGTFALKLPACGRKFHTTSADAF